MAQPSRPLRRSSPGGISYALLENSPRITITEEENSAVEDWLIEAAKVNDLALEVSPPPTIVGGIIFKPPGFKMPGTVLVSEEVTFEPHGNALPMDPFNSDSDAPEGTYEKYAKATITYRLNRNSNDDDDPDDPTTFLTHTINAGAKILAFPPQNTTLNNLPNREVNIPISKVVPTVEHSLKWDYVLTPNWALILSYLGRTNTNTLQFDTGFFAAPNTVLFTGVSGTKRYLWDGFETSSDPWELDFKFSQRYITDPHVVNGPAGWNHVFNPRTGLWEIVRLANGNPLYTSSPLENLFR